MRYVDDGNYVTEEAPLGMRYVRGKFVVKPEQTNKEQYDLSFFSPKTFFINCLTDQ